MTGQEKRNAQQTARPGPQPAAALVPVRRRPARRRKRIEPTLTVDSHRLADELQIHVRTLKTQLAAGRLPTPVRIGKNLRWLWAEIKAWLEAGAPRRDEWERQKKLRAGRKH